MFVCEAIPDDVYVVVTVSVTPVGKVVILGVPVFTIDCVTDLVFVTVAHLVTRVDGLDVWDFVIIPDLVILDDIRLLNVSFTLDDTVVDDDGDLLFLEEDEYVGDAVFVFELLVELETDCVGILLLDGTELNVGDVVDVSAGELVGVNVSLWLGFIVLDPDTDEDGDLVNKIDAVIVFVNGSVTDILPVADDDDEILDVFVCVTELVIVLVISGVFVIFNDPVSDTDTVDVFDELTDFDPVDVCNLDWVFNDVNVEVFVDIVVLDIELLPVLVLEVVTDLDPELDPVFVFDDVTEFVPVIVFFIEFVNRDVLDIDPLADDVFDGFVVIVVEGHDDDVFDPVFVCDPDGEDDVVFEVLALVDVVFVDVVVLVLDADAVIVLLDVALSVCCVVEEDVLLVIADFVARFVLIGVNVCNELWLIGFVGKEVLLDIVVFVEVLESVVDDVGNTLLISNFR